MCTIILNIMTMSFYAGTHAFFDKPVAKKLIKWYQPQVVGDKVVSTVGVDQYTRARVLLESNETSGIIFQHSYVFKTNVFVLEKNADAHTIRTCLWSPEAPKSHCFRALIQYYKYWFPVNDIYAKLQSEDQALWEEMKD